MNPGSAVQSCTTETALEARLFMSKSDNQRGARCPKCGHENGPFQTEINGVAMIRDDGHLFQTSAYYNGCSKTTCLVCDYQGPYREFDSSRVGAYTVILRYPEFLNPDGDWYYTKGVAAFSPQEACARVRQMAFEANLDRANGPEDFSLVSVLAGDVELELAAVEDPLVTA